MSYRGLLHSRGHDDVDLAGHLEARDADEKGLGGTDHAEHGDVLDPVEALPEDGVAVHRGNRDRVDALGQVDIKIETDSIAYPDLRADDNLIEMERVGAVNVIATPIPKQEALHKFRDRLHDLDADLDPRPLPAEEGLLGLARGEEHEQLEQAERAAHDGVVFFQVSTTLSTSRLTFDSGKSGAVADSIRASVASLRPSVVMASALSTRGSTFCDRSRS